MAYADAPDSDEAGFSRADDRLRKAAAAYGTACAERGQAKAPTVESVLAAAARLLPAELVRLGLELAPRIRAATGRSPEQRAADATQHGLEAKANLRLVEPLSPDAELGRAERATFSPPGPLDAAWGALVTGPPPKRR